MAAPIPLPTPSRTTSDSISGSVIVATPDEGDAFPSNSTGNRGKRVRFSNWFSESFGAASAFERISPSTSPVQSPSAVSDSNNNNSSSNVAPLSSRQQGLASSTTPISSSTSQPHEAHRNLDGVGNGRDSEEREVVDDLATSTPLQATLNSANVMLGMGIITLPYGLHISGWVLGISMLTLFALTAQFTAKLLAKCMQVPFPEISDDDPETAPLLENPHRHRRRTAQNESASRLPTSLTDIVELAFGPDSRPLINFIFMFELFAAATGLIILGADSIVALYPELPMLPVKAGVTVILVLSTLPRGMGWLAYTSFLGVVTVASLFLILVYNGLTTYVAPGSLWDWSKTDMWPRETSALGEVKSMWLAAGLFIIGLDAHAIFPGIYRDLKKKEKWGRVVEGAFFLNWSLYVGFASVGYLMFGEDILPQVTQNFPLVPTFPKALTHFILVLTALNPFTKYALIMAPVNLQMEQILGIPTSLSLPASRTLTTFRGALLRIMLGVLAILTTILFPTFHVLIGLVGSFFSFMIVGVIPCLCYLRLGSGVGWRQERIVEACSIRDWERVVCVVIILASLSLGGLGTVASIFSE
ncbi:hypothetical protein HDU77_004111 [Chytriomyces hyalinus]|nr:hypothetical protein HDU77_004111 [Chytriomyces hyalinus]